MTIEKPIAKYSFLPWLRQGLAASINRVDNPAQAGPADPRAEIDVVVVLNVGGTVTKKVQLHGPADITAIIELEIIRTDPRHSVNDFEPNYVPMIEFYNEDFPWRFTPASAAPQERLRPWICLIVLTPSEFTTGMASTTKLPTIKINDPANLLPAPQETWGWAHAHVARDVKGTDGSPDQVLNAVRSVIAEDSSQAISRLICPRKLRPNLTYHAFIIPTFETGRLIGLGQPLPGDVNGLAPAWGSGQDTFPVYYQWEFHTGEKGDFEYLVRLLKAREVDAKVGKRPMDVQDPAPAYDIPGISTPPELDLEGALKAINMVSTQWDQREPFLGALTSFLNLPVDLKVTGSGEPDDPLIAPPLYGQWPAAVERASEGSEPLWFNTLNLDPRNRTAAGFGTRVIQAHQDEYMDIAWKQVGMLQEANRKLRAAQFARFFANSLYQRHLVNAPPQETFTLTSNLHARVLMAAAPVRAVSGLAAPTSPSNAPALSVRAMTRQTHVPVTLLSPAFRRAVRPRGPLQKRIALLAPNAPATPLTAGNILARVNRGEIHVAPPKPGPDGGIVLDDVLKKTEPPSPSGCLLSPPVVWLLTIAAAILHLLNNILPGLKDIVAWLDGLLERIRQVDVVDLTKWTPQQIDQIPPMPNFTITQPGQPLPAGGVGGIDSEQAARFKSALKEMYGLYAASLQPVPVRPALQLEAVTTHLLAELQPARTLTARVRAGIRIDPIGVWTPTLDPLDELLIAPDFPQAMYVPLKTISEELLLPNVGLIPPNTITLLKTNQKFVESYLVGLNHEMAREFIWREYPADQRSTYFRQFWAARESNPDPTLTDKQRVEKLKDIYPIHLWPKSNDLGSNNHRKPGPNGEYLVLLVRGDLFRRYPNTDVYAARAIWHDPPLKEAGNACEIFRTPESDEFYEDESKIRWPIFSGDLGPEIHFFGFDLDASAARGNINDPKSDPGWFFALREHPGEPRFGLDEPLKLEQASRWKDLSWANVAGSLANVDTLNYIQLSKALTSVSIAGNDEKPITFEASKGANAASLAYILLQDPFKAYIHAVEMLPPTP